MLENYIILWISNVGAEIRLHEKLLNSLFQNYHQAYKEAEFHCFQPCIIVTLGIFSCRV